MSPSALLLDSKNQTLETYPQELVELLAEGALSPDARRELDRLHRQRRRIKCADGVIRHVVQRAYPFLRVNPGQERVERGGCALCENTGSEGAGRGTFEIPEKRGAIGAILATRLHPASGGGDKKPPKGRGGGVSRTRKYHKAFAVLWKILEQAGFTSLGGPLEWAELWARVHAQLDAVLIHPESGRTFAHFAWMPGRLYRGGLVDLNRRLRDWDHKELQPEAWAFGIMEAPPVDGQVELYALSSVARASVASSGRQLYPPYKFEVPRSCVACVGRTGPFFALAVGSLNLDGDPQFTKPNFHRLIMQAVADELSPVPVESHYEREVVGFFQRRRVGYVKPVFGNAEGLRPDFVLPNQKMLVEVQGMSDEGYREHKRGVHQRLTSSEDYAGYRLVTYEPNEGETIVEFERRLMGMMRPL
jgi:hypothetical protein